MSSFGVPMLCRLTPERHKSVFCFHTQRRPSVTGTEHEVSMPPLLSHGGRRVAERWNMRRMLLLFVAGSRGDALIEDLA